jgi:hypothetical protein
MVPLAVARMVEDTEAAACADLLAAAPAEWSCVAERTNAGWLLLAPTLDLLLFNRLVGWGLNGPAQKSELETALDRFRATRLTHYGMQLSPAATPDEIPLWLRAAGLERRDSWSKMYRGAGDVPTINTDLRVEEIGREEANISASVVVRAFGMPALMEPWLAAVVGRPGWHHYVAFDGADAVGTAALLVRGDVGWLGIAGTLPTARRRGAQGALMQRRLNDGVSLGCRWFVTETGQDTPERPNPSFHNMQRLGFQLAYHRPNYLLPSR